jgi:hypothetical protein
MGGKGLFRSSAGGHVSGLARRFVVLALIGAAFAGTFATSAFAGDLFELRPAKPSNQTIHLGRAYDAVHSISHLTQSLLEFDFEGVYRVTRYAQNYCSTTACCSYTEYYTPLYPDWQYQWCLYEGRYWYLWHWIG